MVSGHDERGGVVFDVDGTLLDTALTPNRSLVAGLLGNHPNG